MSGEAQTVAPVEAADTSALEREIDRIVYDLYGLTEEEHCDCGRERMKILQMS